MMIYLMTTNCDEYRHLEGIGIYVWGTEHTEHVARRAAELGDLETEQLCDAVLAGAELEESVIDLLDRDDRYRAWVERGTNLGWESRS